jgi:uroporphyrinogen III methyltransferase / synthase
VRPPRILVTRPVEGGQDLAALLAARGLEPVAVPTVAIDIESTSSAVDGMLAALDGADWLVLTSANGARAVAARLGERALPPGVRVAAVGPATAGALSESGIGVDHVPNDYITVAIADGLGPLSGRRVLLARADAATPDLREALMARGAVVEEVIAYRTLEAPPTSRDPLRASLADGLSGIAFTSGSTVRGLVRLASPVDRGRARALPALCIGPVTARAARREGFHVPVVADNHTALGLAEAIADHYRSAREDQ